MKVRVPRVGHRPRRIIFDDLAVMVVILPCGDFVRGESPTAAQTRLEFPASHLKGLVGAPLQRLLPRDQRLEHAVGGAAISISEINAS
jgi:hypothetical protein